MNHDATSALRRAARLIRLSGPAGPAPDVVETGDALLCPETGRTAIMRGGFIDVIGTAFEPNFGQRLLDSGPSAWFYDLVRPGLAPWVGMPSFPTEVQNIADRLRLEPGSTVLDIACGQGNFTLELARIVGPSGLVIGLDIAGAMLQRAAKHLHESGLTNVVLLRADALSLPVADASIPYMNCSGGLHQFPDLKRALSEMARTNTPGGRMTISGFAAPTKDAVVGFRRWVQGGDMNFVPMDELEAAMQGAGYNQIEGEMTGRWVGYRWATRDGAPS